MYMNLKKVIKSLDELTSAEVEEYFPIKNIPEGWIDFNLFTPECSLEDFLERGYREVKVRNHSMETTAIIGGDHHSVVLKSLGYTHWYNENSKT